MTVLGQMPYEIQLMALAIGLYLIDSTVMLRPDEGLLVAGRVRWTARFGLDQFLLGGRAFCMLSPLAPHRPVFRLAWRFDRVDAEPGGTGVLPAWASLAADLRPVAPFTLLAGVALFVLLPIGLFGRLGWPVVLAAMAVFYASTGAALGTLYPRRDRADLGGRRFAGFAFECLACPPFGVNMIRRIGLAQRPSEAFPEVARKVLQADDWAAVQRTCAARLDDAIDAEPDGSPRVDALRRQRARFPNVDRSSEPD